ncbi:MAG: hypothetical protein AAF639_34155 [Chloroflexota bacterium]
MKNVQMWVAKTTIIRTAAFLCVVALVAGGAYLALSSTVFAQDEPAQKNPVSIKIKVQPTGGDDIFDIQHGFGALAIGQINTAVNNTAEFVGHPPQSPVCDENGCNTILTGMDQFFLSLPDGWTLNKTYCVHTGNSDVTLLDTEIRIVADPGDKLTCGYLVENITQ